jgi:hypothetical protein
MTSFPVPLPAEVMTRRFPPPWVIEDQNDARFIVKRLRLP